MGTSGETEVLYEKDGGVAILTLNRPDRLNAWTHPMQERLHDLLDEAAADSDVRAIVITGAGRGFCAGFDMDALKGFGDSGVVPEPPSRPVYYTMSIPKPIIAAINGPCAGIGIAAALACDLRFAAAGAKFTTAFSRRGLVAEHGTSWLLPRVVGPSRAFDLLASARVFLAEEALQLGLVDRVAPPERLMEETLAYARDLVENVAPASMATMKWQIYRHLEMALEPSMEETTLLMRHSLTRPDFREGVASFIERRPPAFEPLSGKAGDGGLAGEVGLAGS